MMGFLQRILELWRKSQALVAEAKRLKAGGLREVRHYPGGTLYLYRDMDAARRASERMLKDEAGIT